ncbi:MAG TPA: hypothetical protein V6D00_10645 [Pantanalinema sp.]
MQSIVDAAHAPEQPLVGRLAQSLALAMPTPFFTDLGVPQRVRAPGHVDSHLAWMVVNGMQGLRLDTVQVFDVPAIRQLTKPNPKIPAWQFVADQFPEWKLDEMAAQELTRWLVWHGFIHEALLTAWDLPELASLNRPNGKPAAKSSDILWTPEQWEAFLVSKDLDVPVGYLGEFNDWRAETFREGYDLYLVLETCVSTHRLKMGTLKGDRGRYLYITSAEILRAFQTGDGLPTLVLDWIRSLVYFADVDGRLGIHRLLAALWCHACMNPQGKHQGRPDDIDSHHINRVSLDNRLVNNLPVTVAQHSVIHGAGWQVR